MLASELIEALKKAIEVGGDREVHYTWDSEHGTTRCAYVRVQDDFIEEARDAELKLLKVISLNLDNQGWHGGEEGFMSEAEFC